METKITKEPPHEAVSILQQVNQKTDHVWVFTKLGNGMLLSFEVLCYLSLFGLIAFALYLPSGELSQTEQLANNVTVDTTVKVQEIIEFFIILKGLIVVLGLLMIIPAMLFRTIRRKNNLLEDLNDITGAYLEKNKLK